MSYGVAAALQTAVYELLLEDGGVAALVGSDVYDTVPSGSIPETYVTFGPEEVISDGDKSDNGARHRFVVSVITTAGGFLPAKQVGAAVSDALHNATPQLARGRIIRMQFLKAQARRDGSSNRRRIDLRFEARIEDA